LQRSKLIIHDDTGYALTGPTERKSNFFSLLFFLCSQTEGKNILLIYFSSFFANTKNIERKNVRWPGDESLMGGGENSFFFIVIFFVFFHPPTA
jgi:hypothetical protein